MSQSQHRESKYPNRPGTGLVSLGAPKRTKSAAKLAVPKPVNLPSIKKENAGNDPNTQLVPSGQSGWTAKADEHDAEPASIVERSTWASGEAHRQQQPPSAAWQRAGALNPAEFPSLAASASGKPPLPAPPPSRQYSSPPSQENIWDEDERGPSYASAQHPPFKLERDAGLIRHGQPGFSSQREGNTYDRGAAHLAGDTYGPHHSSSSSSRLGSRDSQFRFGPADREESRVRDRQDLYHRNWDDRYSHSYHGDKHRQEQYKSRQERAPASFHGDPSSMRWGPEPLNRYNDEYMNGPARSSYSEPEARWSGSQASKSFKPPLAADYDPGLFPPMPNKQIPSARLQSPNHSDRDEEREAFHAELERVAAQLQQEREANAHKDSPDELAKEDQASGRQELGSTDQSRPQGPVQSAWGHVSKSGNLQSELTPQEEIPSFDDRDDASHDGYDVEQHEQRKAKELADAQAAALAALSKPPPPGAEPAFERRPASAAERRGDLRQQTSSMVVIPPPPPPPHPKPMPAQGSSSQDTYLKPATVDHQSLPAGVPTTRPNLPSFHEQVDLTRESALSATSSAKPNQLGSAFEPSEMSIKETQASASPQAPASASVKPGTSWRSVLSGLPDTSPAASADEEQAAASVSGKSGCKDSKRIKGKYGKAQQAAGLISPLCASEVGSKAAKAKSKSSKGQSSLQDDPAGANLLQQQQQVVAVRTEHEGHRSDQLQAQHESSIRGSSRKSANRGSAKGKSGQPAQHVSSTVPVGASVPLPLVRQGSLTASADASGAQPSTSNVNEAVVVGNQSSVPASAAAFGWSSPLADEVAKLQLSAAASVDIETVVEIGQAPAGTQSPERSSVRGVPLLDQEILQSSAGFKPSTSSSAATSTAASQLIHPSSAGHSPTLGLLGDDVITALPADLSLDLADDTTTEHTGFARSSGLEPSMSAGFGLVSVQQLETSNPFPGGLFAMPSVGGLNLWQHTPTAQELPSAPSLAAAAQSLYNLSQQQPHFTFGTHTNIPISSSQARLLPAAQQQMTMNPRGQQGGTYSFLPTGSAFVPTGKQPDWSTPHARTGSPVPLTAYSSFTSQHEKTSQPGGYSQSSSSSLEPARFSHIHQHSDERPSTFQPSHHSHPMSMGQQQLVYDPAAALPDDVFGEGYNHPGISSTAPHPPSNTIGMPSSGRVRRQDLQAGFGKPTRGRPDGNGSAHPHHPQPVYGNGAMYGNVHGNKALAGYGGSNTSRVSTTGHGQGRAHVHGMDGNLGIGGMTSFPPPPPPPSDGNRHQGGRGGRMRAGRSGRGGPQHTKNMYLPKAVAGVVHGSKDIAS